MEASIIGCHVEHFEPLGCGTHVEHFEPLGCGTQSPNLAFPACAWLQDQSRPAVLTVEHIESSGKETAQ